MRSAISVVLRNFELQGLVGILSEKIDDLQGEFLQPDHLT